MTQTHELRLKIDASAAQEGSRQFTAALNAVRAAVRSLEKDSAGMFTSLSKPINIDTSPIKRATNTVAQEMTRVDAATDKTAANIIRTQLASATAIRVSTNAAQRLRLRLLEVGDTAGIDRTTQRLTALSRALASASTPLDVRVSKNQFQQAHDADSRSAINAQEARWNLKQQALAEMEATTAAKVHANELDVLANKYNPLRANSLAYAQALEEISRAESAGVITSQLAAQARTRAAASLATNTTQAPKSRVNNAAIVNAGAQFADIGVMLAANQNPFMLAMQQGTQLSAVLNQMGGKAGILKTIAGGFAQMINPVSLVTFGVILAGSAIVNWMTSADTSTKTFTQALGDANSAVSAITSATENLSSNKLGSLSESYGRVNEELRIHLERLTRVAELEALGSNKDLIGAAQSQMTGGWITNDIDDTRIALNTTNDSARYFLDLLGQVKQAQTFQEQSKAITSAREYLNSLGITLENSEGAAREMLIQLTKSEDSALKLAHAGETAATAIGNATGQTYNWASAMSLVGVQISGIMASLANIGGGAISRAAGAAELTALNAGKSVQQATEARARAELDQKLKVATMDASGRGPVAIWANAQLAKMEKYSFEASAAQNAALAEARKVAEKRDSKSAGGGAKGGGGFKPIDDKKVTSDILKRAQALDIQNNALKATIASHYRSEEAAKLYGEAMVAGNGKISEGTRLLLDQIDAQASLNKALEMEAKNPLQDYLDSLPTVLSATKQVSADIHSTLGDSLTDALMGKFDAKSMVDSMRLALAKQTSGVIMRSLFNKADKPAGDIQGGGTQAGQTIGNAMVTAGNQVANAIRQAITGGGRQAGSAVRSGVVGGGASASSSLRMAGVQHGQQIRSGGRGMGTAITTASATGAASMGTAITSAASLGGAAGGAGGGGMGGAFTGFIASLFGFSEGGYSDGTSPHRYSASPAAFHNAPQYAQGTPNTSGIPAILHPNEAVIPLSRGRKIPIDMGKQSGGGGGGVTTGDFNLTTHITIESSGDHGDSKTAARMAGQVAEMVNARVRESMAAEMAYGGIMNPRGR